jgi:hypothetical protein
MLIKKRRHRKYLFIKMYYMRNKKEHKEKKKKEREKFHIYMIKNFFLTNLYRNICS